MEKDKTVGKIAIDLQQEADNKHTVIDQMQENLTDYDKNIWLCVDNGKKKYPQDFYVVVLCKKERLLENVLRNFFINRISAPTPGWDQTVYKYHRSKDFLEFLWVVPSKDTCIYMTEFKHEIPLAEQELLGYVMSFNSGALDKLAKQLNGEKEFSPLLEDK